MISPLANNMTRKSKKFHHKTRKTTSDVHIWCVNVLFNDIISKKNEKMFLYFFKIFSSKNCFCGYILNEAFCKTIHHLYVQAKNTASCTWCSLYKYMPNSSSEKVSSSKQFFLEASCDFSTCHAGVV